MSKLLILADDLTGALDSGVQLTNKGYSVQVCTDLNDAFNHVDRYDVVVIDTESRHLPAKEAYDRIYALAQQAVRLGIEHIYKKTDSGLRGNVGSELSALLDATQQAVLHFVPAYPKLHRITINGNHYVNGVPLAESVFAKDVIDPVKASSVKEIIQLQSKVSVAQHGEEGIIVHDCRDDDEMGEIGQRIFLIDHYPISAGCAGLLEAYPSKRQLQAPATINNLHEKLLVIAGSINEVSVKQIDRAVKKGALRYHVPMSRIANGKWSDAEIEAYTQSLSVSLKPSTTVILDTQQPFELDNPESNGQVGQVIAKSMGKLVCRLVTQFADFTFMIIGGDTLQGFMHELGIHYLSPVQEIVPGVVLAKYIYLGEEHFLVTKSGAFGSDHLLEQVESFLHKKAGIKHVDQ